RALRLLANGTIDPREVTHELHQHGRRRPRIRARGHRGTGHPLTPAPRRARSGARARRPPRVVRRAGHAGTLVGAPPGAPSPVDRAGHIGGGPRVTPPLFPFAEYWWLYAVFAAGIRGLLALDLGVLHRDARPVSVREAAGWSAVWVSLALLFNVALYFYVGWVLGGGSRPGLDADDAAWQTALEFLTGYLVEYSLSVDNIFVFVLVLRYFAVPAAH